jgi:dTMP kinase
LGSEDIKSRFSGRFIVLDGPDGCGKATQTRLLVKWLCRQGVETVSFRDPGDTAIGEKIRNPQAG